MKWLPAINSSLCAFMIIAMIGSWAGATPVITSVNGNPDKVGRYEKIELTVGLKASFANPYDPDEADLAAEFASPSGKFWRVNGFYDGANWKIRFAPNETGDWSCVVEAADKTGSGRSKPFGFSCVASTNHGWVRVAPNHRYLMRDDGSSFFGVGACYPWGNTPGGFDRMQALGCNLYVYWNGTYDRDGGGNLIESTNSGLGHYDQGKCARIDNIIDWSEKRGLGMILVIWPHDYLSEGMKGWPAGWSRNPYKTITSSRAFYSDTNAWACQEKLYRYIIARWGYSTSLAAWQTIDEISGTSGWSNRVAANAWTRKMADYFHDNDPFQHPTTASHGDYWAEGDQDNDLPNTEVYRNYSTTNMVATIERLWNGYEKPCIMGETGANRSAKYTHRALWATLGAGIAATPLFWSFNQGWTSNSGAQFAPFEKFIADIDFAKLTSLAQAKVSVTDADACGIASDQLTFGWVSGDIAGKYLTVAGLKNGDYRLHWWDCHAGTVIASKIVTVSDGTLSAAVPTLPPADTNSQTSAETDLAFKIRPR